MKNRENENDVSRREILRLASLMPLALALGCSAVASPADIEVAIRKFIFAVGPWSRDQRDTADDFANRFLAAGGVASEFFRQGQTATRLAGEAPFRDAPMALDSLDLSLRSDSERQFLIRVVQQIYGLLEVQYWHVSGVPDVGVCAGREQYTPPTIRMGGTVSPAAVIAGYR